MGNAAHRKLQHEYNTGCLYRVFIQSLYRVFIQVYIVCLYRMFIRVFIQSVYTVFIQGVYAGCLYRCL
jgi:hypothetical protein